ncbi:MAG: adenylyltransferase/cytidyltransferase family protein [Sphaerimonospora mesophila]
MKRVIVSGFFNPLHGGHLDIIEAARQLGDYLIVLVNNDEQQLEKKGKIILDQDNRARLMAALRGVDEVIIGIDPAGNHWPSTKTLELVANKYPPPDNELIFANGGDRSDRGRLPGPEGDMCIEKGIKMVFGVGTDVRGLVKPDSSSRINQALGHEE